MKSINIRGARKHNLKNISLKIPKNILVGVTGVSGSGKSTLAVDTVYAEGQRRYVESLSSYARQFLKQVESAEVEMIENISPTIAVTGQAGGLNARSTVGTITEVDDFLRLLFAKISDVRCEGCGKIVKRHSLDEVEEEIFVSYGGKKVLAGIEISDFTAGGKKPGMELLEMSGFRRIYSDGELFQLGNWEKKKKLPEKSVAVIDRIFVSTENRARLARALDVCQKASSSSIVTIVDDTGKKSRFSLKNICPSCKTEYELPTVQMFSFNSALGACEECSGFGRVIRVDEEKVIPDARLSLKQKAIFPFSKGAYRWWQYSVNGICKKMKIPMDKPYKDLTEEQKNLIWEGIKGHKGINAFFQKLERKKYKVQNRVLLARYRKYDICGECKGTRLRKKSQLYFFKGKTFSAMQGMQMNRLLQFFQEIPFTPFQKKIAGHVMEEILSRLTFINNVGLHYIQLKRLSRTLSGGELRRIQLAQGIGRTLCDVLYVLDEPTIGLHVTDIGKLMQALKGLKVIGNTVMIIEHDRSIIKECDHVIDLGPLAGARGGKVLYEGSYSGLLRCKKSVTGEYFSGRKTVSIESMSKMSSGEVIRIEGAREHNLKDLSLDIPTSGIIAVTGVSGAGKSTLVRDILYKYYQRKFKKALEVPGEVDQISGLENIEDMYFLDQGRIASTPKGNIATFTGLMAKIRNIFASTKQAKDLKFSPGHFSFNSKKGRCDKCEGLGYEIIDMQFLANVTVPCKFCEGTRYKSEILKVFYKEKTIHDVLKMTVDEAKDFFSDSKVTIRELDWLKGFGLGYICLGQTLDTLSAGESQRMKLSDIVSKNKGKGKSVYIFDEPSVGLHLHDLHYILECLQRLKDAGNTVIIVEHNMDVIRNADYVIDLGPGGGEEGGYIQAEGNMKKILASKKSLTGKILRESKKIVNRRGAKAQRNK